MEITLVPMTKALCREYFKGFSNDPCTYMDMTLFRPFEYSEALADAYFERQALKKRVFLAVMFEDAPIGEVLLKDIDLAARECTLGIHLQNDSVKGRGFGTQAERLTLGYAFSRLGVVAVNADAVLENTRSQHVLEKVGFRYVREEGIFRYYRCDYDSFSKCLK